MTNKEVEEKAVSYVLKYLAKQGEIGKRVKGCGYDIKTKTRKIEVKARKERARILQLNYSNINAFNKYNDIELWAVVGVGTNTPELMIVSKKKLLERKREHKMWKFNLRNCEFEKSIKL